MKNDTTITTEPLMEELLTARNAMDQLARLGAQQMLQKALEVEREAFLERHANLRAERSGWYPSGWYPSEGCVRGCRRAERSAEPDRFPSSA